MSSGTKHASSEGIERAKEELKTAATNYFEKYDNLRKIVMTIEDSMTGTPVKNFKESFEDKVPKFEKVNTSMEEAISYIEAEDSAFKSEMESLLARIRSN